MLLATWFDDPHRATRDVDLLGFGDSAEDALLDTFREIMAIEQAKGPTSPVDAGTCRTATTHISGHASASIAATLWSTDLVANTTPVAYRLRR